MGTMKELSRSVAEQIGDILTPQLLDDLYKLYFRWSDTHTLSDAQSIMHILWDNSTELSDELYVKSFPALKALSVIGLEKIAQAPLSVLIPASPAHMAFPAQAMGLHILLDQATRFCLSSGTNARWIQPFGIVDLAISEKLLLLRDESNPYKMEAWRGLCPERIFLRQFIMHTSQIHCERQSTQALGQKLAETYRVAAEKHYKIRDFTRAFDEADSTSLTGFPELIRAGPPSDLTSPAEGIFHCLRVIRVHEPIIIKFHRYPYRNASRWVASTEEEETWLKEVNNFGRVDEETERLIREDTEAGRVTPIMDVKG